MNILLISLFMMFSFSSFSMDPEASRECMKKSKGVFETFLRGRQVVNGKLHHRTIRDINNILLDLISYSDTCEENNHNLLSFSNNLNSSHKCNFSKKKQAA